MKTTLIRALLFALFFFIFTYAFQKFGLTDKFLLSYILAWIFEPVVVANIK